MGWPRLVVLATSTGLVTAIACGGEAFTTSDSGDGDGAGGSDGTGGSGDGDGTGGTGDGDGDGDGSGGDSGSGGSLSVDRSCFSTYECTLVQSSCCSTCSPPSLAQVLAITRGQEQAARQEVCGDEPVDCVDCESPPNPHLFAACVEETCEAFDLREHPDSACSSDEDCEVIPAACCPCGAGNGPGEIVAAGGDAQEFKRSQCERTPLCAECVWEPPVGITAVCAQGQCRLDPPVEMAP